MNHGKDGAIRARAYQLWIESGYADGYQDAHWRQAEREVSQQGDDDAQRGVPPSAAAPVAETRHVDGMSLHPSVIDPGPSHRGH